MIIKMLGELCVIKSQNLSNLCIEHVQKYVQKHQIETVVSTLNILAEHLSCCHDRDVETQILEIIYSKDNPSDSNLCVTSQRLKQHITTLFSGRNTQD